MRKRGLKRGPVRREIEEVCRRGDGRKRVQIRGEGERERRGRERVCRGKR